jgi:hypothetical protein
LVEKVLTQDGLNVLDPYGLETDVGEIGSHQICVPDQAI